MRKIRKTKFNNFLANYIKNNLNKYILVSIIFIIGLVIGIFFTNNMQDDAKLSVSQYISTFIENLRTNNVNIIKVLQNSLFQNLILIIVVWFLGSTVLGFPMVILIIGYRGFIFRLYNCLYNLNFRNWQINIILCIWFIYT